MIIHFLILLQMREGGGRAVGFKGALMINDVSTYVFKMNGWLAARTVSRRACLLYPTSSLCSDIYPKDVELRWIIAGSLGQRRAVPWVINMMSCFGRKYDLGSVYTVANVNTIATLQMAYFLMDCFASMYCFRNCCVNGVLSMTI